MRSEQPAIDLRDVIPRLQAMGDTVVWRSVFEGRPDTDPEHSLPGVLRDRVSVLRSRIVVYASANGRVALVRWTTTDEASPISGWFVEGGENPIEERPGDQWTDVPAATTATRSN